MTNLHGRRFCVDVDMVATEGWRGLSLGARLLRCLLPIAAHDDHPAGFCADPDYLGHFFTDFSEAETPVAEWLAELDRAELVRVTGSGEDAEGVMLLPARVV